MRLIGRTSDPRSPLGRPRRPGASGGPRLAPLASMFFLAGFALSNWAVRIPDVKDQVGASESALGFALLCQSVGGLVAMAVGSRLCLRFGTRPVTLVAGFFTCLALQIPPLSTSPVLLGGALVTLGLIYGTMNIALNSAAVELERAAGRSIMSTLHGLYSAGAMAGALVGGLAARGLSPTAHLALVGAIGVATIFVAGRPLLAADWGDPHRPGADGERATESRRRWLASLLGGPGGGVIWLFAVMAFCTAFGEFTAIDWAALHMRDDVGAGPTAMAAGLLFYEFAMMIGRLAGGRIIGRFGATAVLCGGAGLAVVGGTVAAWAGLLPTDGAGLTPGLIAAYVGYLLLGLGLANVFPIAIARAGAIGGPTAVARTAMAGSLGIMLERPIIGTVADGVGLPGALSLVILLVVVIGVIGVVTRGR